MHLLKLQSHVVDCLVFSLHSAPYLSIKITTKQVLIYLILDNVETTHTSVICDAQIRRMK